MKLYMYLNDWKTGNYYFLLCPSSAFFHCPTVNMLYKQKNSYLKISVTKISEKKKQKKEHNVKN